MPIDSLSVSCAQLTRDLLAIAKFLFDFVVDLMYSLLYNLAIDGGVRVVFDLLLPLVSTHSVHLILLPF